MKKLLALLLLLPGVALAQTSGKNIAVGSMPPDRVEQQPAKRILGNCTASTASVTACTPAQAITTIVTGTPTAGQVVRWDGTNAVWGAGGGNYSITAFAPTTPQVEVGQTLAMPAFTAAHSSTPTSLLLTNNDNGESRNVVSTPTAFTSAQSYTKTTVNATVTFTLTGSDGFSTDARTTSIGWRQKIFWGVSSAPANTEAFIEALAGSELNAGLVKTFTVNASGANKIYYAARASAGTPAFTVGGFEGGFILRSSSISVTNTYGFTENYQLWESNNAGLGNTTVNVTLAP